MFSSQKCLIILTVIVTLISLFSSPVLSKSQNPVIDDINDIKDFKKLLRTKTNVLICFVSSNRKCSSLIKTFKEVGAAIKGQGTLLLVDCSADGKKLCKKLKIDPNPAVLKHYKDGEYHKDYDRKETVTAMLNFMRDPSGEMPWVEEDIEGNIVHIPDTQSLMRFLRKQQLPTLVMFYAPWCGFCKQLKPEFAAAAAELKGRAALVAVDVNQPENAIARSQFNITGFPTLLYFENGSYKLMYEGENKKDSLIEFMKNPRAPPVKPKEESWAESSTSITHLTDTSFETILNESQDALVMFYAPWCGHCKRMKPEYEKAAQLLSDKEDNKFLLAALDATKEREVAKAWSIKGYPTTKYFKNGVYQFDVSVRTADEISKFVADPKEPPPPPPPEKPWSDHHSDVLHLGVDDFKPIVKKKKHTLVMFYAPWCGHCKKAKPEFTLAASELSEDPRIAFAAVDCTVHSSVCSAYNVTGYPTIKLFHYLNKVEPVNYNGARTTKQFLHYMAPFTSLQLSGLIDAKSDKPGADDWGMGRISHYTGGNFDSFLNEQDHIMVLFYAPWCSHCQKLKNVYTEAAQNLKTNNINCRLAAVDIAAYPEIGDRLSIVGLPTMKYFLKGKFITDYKGSRDSNGIVDFLKNPPNKPSNLEKDEL